MSLAALADQPHALALPRPYEPWWAQKRFHRSRAPIRCVVAGRQSGKTHAAAEEVVRIMLARPGTESCLLMPTYRSTKAALRHLKRALKPLGRKARWKAVDKCFELFNGSLLYVRTADDKEGVPTRLLLSIILFFPSHCSFLFCNMNGILIF